MSREPRSSRFLFLFLAVALVLAGSTVGGLPGLAATGSVTLVVNDVPIECDVPPQIVEGRVLVPLRAVAEALGLPVTWDPANAMAVVGGAGLGQLLPGGGIRLVVNGLPVLTDVPPQMVRDRVLVPIRVIAEQLGCTVTWNAATQVVSIERPEPPRVLVVNGPPATGTLTESAREHVYTFEAVAGLTYTAELGGPGPEGNPTVTVKAPDGTPVEVRTEATGRFSWEAAGTGRYSVIVGLEEGGAGSYDLRLTVTVPPGQLVPGVPVTARIDTATGNRVHTYRLPVKSGKWYQMTAGGESGANVTLYKDESGSSHGFGSNGWTRREEKATSDRTWRIEVGLFAGDVGDYTLIVSEIVPVPLVPDGPAVSAQFDAPWETHWYSFVAESGKSYAFNVTPHAMTFWAHVMVRSASSASGWVPLATSSRLMFEPGPVSFFVYPLRGTGKYDIRITSSTS